MTENKAIFETMPIGKALAYLAIPTIISQLITMIYNLADTFFIGQTNDPLKIAATSVAFNLVFLMNALSNLFGIGGGSLISRLLGLNKEEEAKKVFALSIFGTIAVTILYSSIILIFMDPILRLLGASNETIGYAKKYTLWVAIIGSLPCTLSMTMAHLLRSEGYTKHASVGLGMGGILNIALDPLFMFVILPQGNEVLGAAIATMTANICSLIYFCIVFIMLKNKAILSINPKLLPSSFKHLKSVFAVGFPSALGSALACFSSIIMNNLSSNYGDIPVAAVGIVKKIDMLPTNVGMGLCQGMMPLVAYNYSTKNYKRMRAAARYARISGIIFALLCVLSFELLAPQIVSLFIKEEETLSLGTNFLRICCLATPLMIINFQMSYMFQAMGKGPQSLILSSLRQGLINMPLLFIMNAIAGLYGVVWTQLLSDSITLIISFSLYHVTYKKILLLEAASS